MENPQQPRSSRCNRMLIDPSGCVISSDTQRYYLGEEGGGEVTQPSKAYLAKVAQPVKMVPPVEKDVAETFAGSVGKRYVEQYLPKPKPNLKQRLQLKAKRAPNLRLLPDLPEAISSKLITGVWKTGNPVLAEFQPETDAQMEAPAQQVAVGRPTNIIPANF